MTRTSGIPAEPAACWSGGNGGGRVQLPQRNNGILILAWKTAKDKEWLSSGWLEDEKKKKKKKSCVEKYFDVGPKGRKKADNLASDRLAM